MNEHLIATVTELKTWFLQVLAIRNAWLLLPGFLGLAAVYYCHYSGRFPLLLEKSRHEDLAVWLVAAIILVLLIKWLSSRDPLVLYLAVLAMIFLVRELDATHWQLSGSVYKFKSKKAVDLLLVAMLCWGVVWQRRLFSTLNRFVFLKISLCGVVWTYLLSQLVARRAFRTLLPAEELLNVPLEETLETVAHLFFLGMAVCCCYLIPRRLPQRRGSSARVRAD